MVAVAKSGIHFSDPREFSFATTAAASPNAYDSAGTIRDTTTTNFFTEMARRGLQDQTNWTADTYKTILSVSGTGGYLSTYVGCTAGGVETHTIRITVDGIRYTIPVTPMASGSRAVMWAGAGDTTEFTTAADFEKGVGEALASDKATFSDVKASLVFPPWTSIKLIGMPVLTWSSSLLFEAKHSASITNSTATAYSAIQYRLKLGTIS